MAWTERSLPQDETIEDVSPPSSPNNGPSRSISVDKLREVFKDMPPFIKLTSRRARKTLAKYEASKEHHIEQLRDNPTFKFVMMVAGLTNEPMQKYWKGDSVDPFSDKYTQSSNTRICKEDLAILLKRARENSFADLHQFCRNIEAIPMYRKAKEGTIGKYLVPEGKDYDWIETYDVSDDSDYDPTSDEDNSDKDDKMYEEAVNPEKALGECKREKAKLEQELKDCGGYDDGKEAISPCTSSSDSSCTSEDDDEDPELLKEEIRECMVEKERLKR